MLRYRSKQRPGKALAQSAVAFSHRQRIIIFFFGYFSTLRWSHSATFILDQLGGRWREACLKLMCCKAKFLGKVIIDALTKGTPVTTGMFSHLSFRCDKSKATYYNQPVSSRVFKISQGDICFFEQYLTRLPQRNVSFVLVTHGHNHHGSSADLNTTASKCFRKILDDDRINAYLLSLPREQRAPSDRRRWVRTRATRTAQRTKRMKETNENELFCPY
uniref:Uncharacterized protein n=1 Tax=Ostreococcus mediterraneus TaxID=1486918 RepID=A0A7S0Z5U9_9CHLO|mmetsp:Transcript_3949/g.8523  ORF Transcript_3949/g.8523 Transcript_3949/m.8523 type:complete len:218 (+) Transcript_3949:139-792(+)